MRPEAIQGSATQVRDICGQFEQMLLTALVPQSLFKGSGMGDSADNADSLLASENTQTLFGQAFAAAIERDGGLGLAPELARMLSETGS